MVERFIFPEETKVCLKGLFLVTKTNFAQYTFKQRFPTKQTNKTTEKKVCFGEFQTSSVEVLFQGFGLKTKVVEKGLFATRKQFFSIKNFSFHRKNLGFQ